MRPGFRRLQWRIAAWTALILLSVQIGGLFLFEQIGRGSALQEVRSRLETGDRVFARVLEQRSDQLAQAARVLAADYGFRAALLSSDRPTIASALENHGSRIGASLMLLVGLDAAPIAAHPPRGELEISGLGALIDEARAQGSATGFRAAGGSVYQLVVVPVMAPVPVAWVLLGFAVDEVLARDLQRLTGLDVSLLLQPPSAPARIVASTLPTAPQAALLAAGARLHALLAAHGLQARGPALFKHVEHPDAARLHDAFARRAILLRAFEHPPALRFGLPADEAGWARLAEALPACLGPAPAAPADADMRPTSAPIPAPRRP